MSKLLGLMWKKISIGYISDVAAFIETGITTTTTTTQDNSKKIKNFVLALKTGFYQGRKK